MQARVRFFPGSWIYDDNRMFKIPSDLRPCYLVTYHTREELDLAQSVEPKWARVQYHYVGPF